jgi:ribosomal protein S18 acetylase RimI-like enzyme
MMIILEPMSVASFERFKAYSIADFAEQMQRTGEWEIDRAPALAEAAFARLLPEGLLTTDNYLFDIKDRALGECVGAIWAGVVEEERREGFIFDLVVHEPYRRQGYAKWAMREVEAFFVTLNVRSIALEVYFDNVGAQRLYAESGYQVTSQSMRKTL